MPEKTKGKPKSELATGTNPGATTFQPILTTDEDNIIPGFKRPLRGIEKKLEPMLEQMRSKINAAVQDVQYRSFYKGKSPLSNVVNEFLIYTDAPINGNKYKSHPVFRKSSRREMAHALSWLIICGEGPSKSEAKKEFIRVIKESNGSTKDGVAAQSITLRHMMKLLEDGGNTEDLKDYLKTSIIEDIKRARRDVLDILKEAFTLIHDDMTIVMVNKTLIKMASNSNPEIRTMFNEILEPYRSDGSAAGTKLKKRLDDHTFRALQHRANMLYGKSMGVSIRQDA